MSDSVHIRNARALDNRNKQFTGELSEYRTRLIAVETQNAQLRQRLDLMEEQVMTLFAMRGHGPTG